MRSLITSSACVAAMFATGFTAAQQDEDFLTSSAPATVAWQSELPAVPVAPAPPLSFGPRQRDPFAGSVAAHPALMDRLVGSKEERAVKKKVSTATRMLKSQDEATRTEGEDQLKDAVGELFDLRTKSRRKDIESLEKRLAELRKQLEKREDKKGDIVRLHVQTLINQANGLGF